MAMNPSDKTVQIALDRQHIERVGVLLASQRGRTLAALNAEKRQALLAVATEAVKAAVKALA